MIHEAKERLWLIKFISIILVTLSYSAVAEIYKWKDSEGAVYFSDRNFEKSSEAVILKRDISKEKIEQASKKAKEFVRRQQRKTAFKQEAVNKAKERARKASKTREQRDLYCRQAKKELTRLKLKIPVYQLNKSGERRYLNEAQRTLKVSEWSQNIRKYCK